MNQSRHGVESYRGLRQTVQYAPRQLSRRRQRFCQRHRTVGLIENHDVGKSAADVNRYPQRNLPVPILDLRFWILDFRIKDSTTAVANEAEVRTKKCDTVRTWIFPSSIQNRKSKIQNSVVSHTDDLPDTHSTTCSKFHRSRESRSTAHLRRQCFPRARRSADRRRKGADRRRNDREP
jgi:hypothetical protein